MLKLIQSFFGLLFFCFVFGVLWVKNLPSYYSFEIGKEMPYPLISYVERIDQINTAAGGKNIIYPALTPWINENEIALFNKTNDSIVYTLPTQLYFTLDETWRFDFTTNQMKVRYSFSPIFYSKLLLVINPDFFDAVRKTLSKKLQTIDHGVKTDYLSHRWEYLGENDFPMTYYLALEGESNWQNAAKSYQAGQQKLLEFARNRALKVIGDPFVLYPRISPNGVRWRAAVAVDKYYLIDNLPIKCRRFRGGKVLQMTHKGPLTMISNSWQILLDSLGNNQQAYPAIQQPLGTANASSNPLNWETILSLPIN